MILFTPASEEGGSAVKALLRTSQMISKVSQEDGRRFPSESLNPSLTITPLLVLELPGLDAICEFSTAC
jgi:hypothetical protein